MTLQQMQESQEEMLAPADVAEVLGCTPYSINVQCKLDMGKLGFPVCMIGTRVRIPRRGFLRWVLYGNAPVLSEGRRVEAAR